MSYATFYLLDIWKHLEDLAEIMQKISWWSSRYFKNNL